MSTIVVVPVSGEGWGERAIVDRSAVGGGEEALLAEGNCLILIVDSSVQFVARRVRDGSVVRVRGKHR